MATTLLPKQRLKDYCRKKQLPSPIYVLIDEEKIDLHKHYTIQVCINDVVTAEGRGLSRRIAEFKAAMSAMYLIGQSDPTVFDNNRPQKFGRLSLGRSFSVDHISQAQRTDSMPSMMSLAVGPGQFSSAAPSIDGIDSLTENNDSLYGSETATGKDDYANRNTTIANNKGDEEEASSESTDEGVELEVSEISSATPTASSPTSQTKTVVENQNSQKPDNQAQSSSGQRSLVDSKGETASKSKGKKSLSSSFLSSFFMLSSLRAISRRSLRRKTPSKQSSSKSAEISSENSAANTATTQSRPTSATSSASTSSAFSSISSVSSSQQTTSNSSTSGSFTLPDDATRVDADVPVLNGFSSLMMADTIIEEEEEEDEDEVEGGKTTLDHSGQRKVSTESNRSTTLCNGGHLERHSHDVSLSGSTTLPRSSSSSYVLSSMCPHNHFSIYGPVLCSNQQAAKNLTIEATPSAALLRYCVRLFCPLPYYDIRGSNSKFDQKFYVTCRVVLSTSKTDKDKLPITIPEQYKNYEFTARGNGETLRSARNMAAQTIIDKLKKANIYFE